MVGNEGYKKAAPKTASNNTKNTPSTNGSGQGTHSTCSDIDNATAIALFNTINNVILDDNDDGQDDNINSQQT
eukprot:UN07819